MTKLLVFQTKFGELKAIPVKNEQQARKVLESKQTFKWQGDSVDVKGLFTKEDYEALQIFYHNEPSHYELWKHNMEYLKKNKEWPKDRQ